ncbi:MAG: glutathione peroxidase [Candidatus Hydrogenedentes bacterium]|nr:glutathione peroxidase [Candidatus Hydrogenedentota bacterium]
MPDSVLGFEVKDIDGNPVKLGDKYAGKVLLIVNTASKCGYTPQYADLESLYQKYHDKGLEILAFPSNDFGGQEPGSESEIKEFCSTKFNVTFPLFSKVPVKGDAKVPLYQFLTDAKTNPASPGEIKWNFTKFLVGRDGKIVARYESSVKPSDDQVTKAVEDALAAKPEEKKAGA